MSAEDRLRWDAKYRQQLEAEPAGGRRDDRPEWILSRARSIAAEVAPNRGSDGDRPLRALDLACGPGSLALALATECGFTVDGVDVSSVAIATATDAAREAGASATFLAADLDTWRPGKSEYDLIVVHRFLDRVHLPVWIPTALRPGGHLLYGTFLVATAAAGETSGPQNPAYRLQPGELARLYGTLEIVESVEEPQSAFAWPHARRSTKTD